jgi:DNA-binding transcriptional MerR regulator
MYKPSQVAKMVNIHPNSVRNYSREYGEFLSAGARGENGDRVYTDEDVDVLRTIAALRKSGVPPSEVGERVRQRDVSPVIDVTPQEGLQALQPPSIVPSIQLDSYNALHARMDSLERRLDTQVAAQHDRWMTFSMGLWIGMVTTGVILAVAWLVANSW